MWILQMQFVPMHSQSDECHNLLLCDKSPGAVCGATPKGLEAGATAQIFVLQEALRVESFGMGPKHSSV